MKKLLLLFSVIFFSNCQTETSNPSEKMEIKHQKVMAFTTDDKDVNRAVTKAIKYLEKKNIQLDSFYVCNTEKETDSIRLILFHYDFYKMMDEAKSSSNGEWISFPPLSAMPDIAKQLTYVMKDDVIVESSVKENLHFWL